MAKPEAAEDERKDGNQAEEVEQDQEARPSGPPRNPSVAERGSRPAPPVSFVHASTPELVHGSSTTRR